MHSSHSSCCHFRHTDTYDILTATSPVGGTQTSRHLSFQLLVSQARAPVTPGVLSSHWHLSIHPEQTDPHPQSYQRNSVTSLEKQQSMFNYLPAVLQLALIVTSSPSSHLCPFSNHLDPPFTHLSPSPKHFIISLAQSQESLSLHPIMTSMSLSGPSAVIQPASSINSSGEFHPWSQG